MCSKFVTFDAASLGPMLLPGHGDASKSVLKEARKGEGVKEGRRKERKSEGREGREERIKEGKKEGRREQRRKERREGAELEKQPNLMITVVSVNLRSEMLKHLLKSN